MRPIKLTMTAFGPYKETEVVNFTELEAHDLFVISGNTGAGKTTIFDGISFALYGTASGQDRGEITMLRSDFAEDHIHTATELEFLLKGKHYRILRQLGHVKAGNKSKTGEKYEFFEIVGEEEIPCVDRQIVSEINAKVEEIIGLTQDQFKQIVMLPQGEFRKLLTSDTENKEAILRRLFKTENYKALNNVLQEQKNNAEVVYRQGEKTKNDLISSITSAVQLRDGSLLAEALAADFHNTHQIIEALEQEINFYENKMQQDELQYKNSLQLFNEKQSAYYKAEGINNRFFELKQLRAALDEMQQQTVTYEAKERQLEAAGKANRISLYEQQRDQAVQEEKEKKVELAEAEQMLKTAKSNLEKAEAAYQFEVNRKKEREHAVKEQSRLEELLPVVQSIEEKKQELQALEKMEKKSREELSNIKAKLEAQERVEQEQRQVKKKLDQTIDELADKPVELERLKGQAKVFLKYRKLREEVNESKQFYNQKTIEYNKVKAAYNEKEDAWLNNQAVVLAEHLQKDAPCPVCGSTHHPMKALHGEEAVTREQLAALKKQLETEETAYQKVYAQLERKRGQFADATEEIREYTTELEQIDAQYDELVRAGGLARDAVARLDKAKEQMKELRLKEEQTVKIKAELEPAYQKRTEDHQQLVQQISGESAALKERLSSIPEELTVRTALEAQIEFAKKKRQQLESAWENAQKQFENQKEAFTKAEANVHHLRKHLEALTVKQQEASQVFLQKLEKEQFADVEAYLQAKLPEQEQASLKNDIETFKQKLAVTSQRTKELEAELKDKAQADLHALKNELSDLTTRYEAALEHLNQSRKNLEAMTERKDKIIETDKKLKESERHLSVIADVYDTLRGQNSKRISFERFLQMEYLEQIIHSANLRLQKLSNNQYYLTRSDRQESHGRQSGLALDVYDSHTGVTRDVKTLSGGEKFHAALSLALGMSDVIQSFQGNISIDTMFIDEGFGSLDEEALMKAVDALIEIMETGRMIGVISHVKELKDIFPAILEVKKTKEGHSKTSFVIK